MTYIFDIWASTKTEATRKAKNKHPTYKITYLKFTGETRLVHGKIVGQWDTHMNPYEGRKK